MSDELSWGIRYWALNDPESDPTDEDSWTEAVFVFESELEATQTFDEWAEVYKEHPNIRGLQLVNTPKIQWNIAQRVEYPRGG